MKAFEAKLRERFGLDLGTLGPNALGRAVLQRTRALGLRDADELWRLLERFPAHWQGLAEMLLITETWFFRDRNAFSALARIVAQQWVRAQGNGCLRLLSAPCASGEEPYSIVMALLEAGSPRNQFRVDAVDLSPQALARAAQGIYGEHAFRGEELQSRRRYFSATPEGYLLDASVREHVHLKQGNVLDPDCLPGTACYDVIFCRNLLIYMHAAAQKTVLLKLERLLAPDGILFLGPAEQALAIEFGFVPVSIPMAFACRRAPACVIPEPITVQQTQTSIAGPSPPRPAHRAQAMETDRSSSLLTIDAPSPDLELALQLANAGQLSEAAALCESHLRAKGTSTQAYYLLGLVRDAAGDATASDCYRKALYLDPRHHGSLVHLALLAEQRGDLAAARHLRLRAERSTAA